MKRSAFTLLELLLVLGVIIVVSAIGVAGYQRQHARSQFKSGVMRMQVDVACARVLAMQSGNAYIFRYVPGSGIYEIAPLKTLQEALYRVHGDLGQNNGYDALGGTLSSNDPSVWGSGYDMASTSIGMDATAMDLKNGGTSAYTDDLFSQENIAADMIEIAKENRRVARLGTTNVDMTGGLGGSLNSSGGMNAYGDGATGYNFNMENAGGLSGSGLGSTGMYETDYSGTGAQFPMGTEMGIDQSSYDPMNYRDLNGSEKLLVDENTLMSRVNMDGLIVRKQIPGNVIFTFMRVSESTPSILRARRPDGIKNDSVNIITGSDEGADLGSTLGGSLHSIPTSSTSEGLGGGLNAIPGTEGNSILGDAFSDEEDPLATSLWSEPLIFFPNGKTSNAVLGFASLGDYSFYSEIALRGMTGVTRISAISATPPEYDPSLTALTQEQLFRLRNPGYANSGTERLDPAAVATGGSLTSTTPTNALGVDESASLTDTDANAGGLGIDASASTSVNYGRAGGGYGSSDRRSGYQFSPSGGTSAADLGIGTAPASNVNLQGGFTGTTTAGTPSENVNSQNAFSAIDDALGNAASSTGGGTGATGVGEQENNRLQNTNGGGL